MSSTVTLAPPNSVLFIADASKGEVPEFIPDLLVLSTDSMISMGCLPDVDGETTVTLGNGADVIRPAELVFDGMLKTPTRRVVVATVEDDMVLAAVVPNVETRIRIWTNRTREPDEVVIGWD